MAKYGQILNWVGYSSRNRLRGLASDKNQTV